MIMANDKIHDDIKMYLHKWVVRMLRCNMKRIAQRACQELYWKPLYAAIGQLLATYYPSGHQGNSKQNNNKTYTYFAGCFDGHGNVLVCNRAHHLMEEVQGFTRSHWTPPPGK
jgi:hypothetical protein